MTARTCRFPSCDRPRSRGKFCSIQCEVYYDDLKDDARNARLADEEAFRDR